MQLPAKLFQHISLFDCCKQQLRKQKQLNLYQNNLAQPLTIKPYNKSQQILKIYQLNDFYSKQQAHGYKVIAKSKYQQQKTKCQMKCQIFTDKQFLPSIISLGQRQLNMNNNENKNKKIIWRRISQMYDINSICIFNNNNNRKSSQSHSYINQYHSNNNHNYQFNFNNNQFNNAYKNNNSQSQLPTFNNRQSLLHRTDILSSNYKDNKFLPIISQFYHNKPQIIKEIFNYCTEISPQGIYRLILNDKGYPKQVIIDDYIPVYQNTSKHLFTKIFNNGEIWHILLEKALAKIFGSYSNLKNIKINKIIKCLTLAPCIKYQLQEGQSQTKLIKIYNNIKQAINKKYLVFGLTKNSIKINILRKQYCYNIVSFKETNNIYENQITIQCLQILNQQQSISSSSNHINTHKLNNIHNNQKNNINNIININNNINNNDRLPLITNNINNYNRLPLITLSFNTFFNNFQQFTICHYSKYSNYDFQTCNIPNRTPLFYNLRIFDEKSNVLISFSRLQKIHKQYQGFNNNTFNFSYIQNMLKQIIQINGGWLKLLIAKRIQQNNQLSFQYIDSYSQTVDNFITAQLSLLKGEYVIYIQPYSQQNTQQIYVFSTYSQSRVQLKRIKQTNSLLSNNLYPNSIVSTNVPLNEYFLEEVMLNYCLNKLTNRNYFGEKNQWYSTHLLYQKGGFGFIVVYLPENSETNVKISYNLQQIIQQEYKVQCKTSKNYSKIIKPGEADVLVLSFNYQAKKYMQKIDFPPKAIHIDIIQ